MTQPAPETAPEPVVGSRLPDLIAMAQEPSSEKRRALLRELTEVFFGTETHTETETDLYGTVLAELSAEMETAVRAELAQRFADSPAAPRALIRRLANDEAEVATPVLSASPVLTDQFAPSIVKRLFDNISSSPQWLHAATI